MEMVMKKKLALPEFIFIILICVIYLIPSVSLGSTLILGILILYSAYLALSNFYMRSAIFKIFILAFLISLFYAFLTETSTISSNIEGRELKHLFSKMYQYFTLYFPAILLLRINYKASEKQKKILIAVVLVLIAYVVILTWSALLTNENITREWSGAEDAAKNGVAGYYFIYAIPIVVSIISICFMRLNMRIKLVSLVTIIVAIIFLVMAQYTLSILIAITGILYQVYRNIRNSLNKMIFLVSVAITTLFLPSILEYIIKIIPSEQVAVRLSEIYDFITGEGANGYNLSGRLTLYSDTVKAFFQSPIYGHRSLNFDGHATFLTVLSDTGILGGIPFYSLLYVVCKYIRNALGENATQFTGVILMFTMMGLTNPVHASMPLGFATWFIAPLMISIIFKEKTENETPVEN